MNTLGTLRAMTLAGLLVASPFSIASVMAAPADVALLKTYLGSWKGKGKLVGKDSETVACKLNLSPGNGDKMNYEGRCALAGTNVTVAGTIQYNDAGRRYEAIMSTNVTFSGVAIGKRRGDAIVFDLREREKDADGNDLTVTAGITLRPAKIEVKFNVLFNDSGEKWAATVPFTK
ncbi:hypothetical protein [Devosia sp.]|uniref:hypothetical protein n=1 Tax=Devosia sp. TaxID=1871048 RepID=UPI003A8E5AAA